MYTVYIIQCEQCKYYIGYTNDLNRRLIEHNSGDSKWTSNFTDWKLIYKEEFNNKTDALKREIFLKKLKNGNTFKNIINNFNAG